MGTPTIGGTITGAVTERSGAIVTGGLQDVGLGTGTTDDTWSVISGATYGTATINPTTGVWSYDLNDNHPALWALGAGQTLTDVFTVRMVDADGRVDTEVITITITGVPCFLRGTMIETDRGPVAVERLNPGDRVLTVDHGFQTLHWVGNRRVRPEELQAAPHLRPVRIKRGALGAGLPARDLWLSPQHRVVIDAGDQAGVYGADEVLIPAAKLTDLAGITQPEHSGKVEYFHLLFDRHEVVFANGLATESLLLTQTALMGFAPQQVEQIRALYPHAFRYGYAMEPARPLVETRREVAAVLGSVAELRRDVA